MSRGDERARGLRWAELERARGAWVQKLPASSVSGIPDWLHVHPSTGITLVEAKTTEAVRKAGGLAAEACSVAQRFTLDMVASYGGRARLLVLGVDCWCLLPWEQARQALKPGRCWRTYDTGDEHGSG